MDVEQRVREYIDKSVHMSLGTTDGTKPWVCEVHFAYDDDLNLYFRSFSARRHSQEIAKNPHVAGNIVRQHLLGESGIGVYFEGSAQMLDKGEERDKAFKTMSDRLQLGGEVLDEASRPDGAQFYKIVVGTYYLFGPFDGKPSQKYELKWNGNQS